jgi:hypothetical protein
MIRYLKTRTKPRAAAMYNSLRAVNCSAPVVLRTSSYIQEISGRIDIKRDIKGPTGNQGSCNSVVTRRKRRQLGHRREDDTYTCQFSVDLEGLPVFL